MYSNTGVPTIGKRKTKQLLNVKQEKKAHCIIRGLFLFKTIIAHPALTHITCSSSSPASSEFVSFSACNFLIRSCLPDDGRTRQWELDSNLHYLKIVFLLHLKSVAPHTHTHPLSLTLHWSPVWAAESELALLQCVPAAGCGESGEQHPFPAPWSWLGGCQGEESAVGQGRKCIIQDVYQTGLELILCQENNALNLSRILVH